MKHAVKRIHFVGIGGAGMSGIAEILHNLGYIVSGSDQSASETSRRLASLGISVAIGHDASHIAGAQAVVTSTAVKGDNPEVIAARGRRVPVVPRAVMLAELMRLKKGIAIAGTHGKTTTTSLVASVLAAAGVDPTFVIGGRLASAGANSRLGSGEYIVVEADESDASFLNLMPVLSVVTNIDADHMDTYGHDFARLKAAFVEFLHRMPFYGAAILCGDDPGVRSIVPMISRPVVSYGFGADVQVRAVDVQALPGGQMHFVTQRRNGVAMPDLAITLNLPGEHNVLNALATIAVATELELPDAAIVKALAEFSGVDRRFQRYGEHSAHGGGSFTLIDDYGHHPAEMAAVLAAARGAFPGRRLVLAFQPHRYTRTRDCFEDFVKVLGTADAVLLCEVYAAGETSIVAADGRALARALRVAGKGRSAVRRRSRGDARGDHGTGARRRRGDRDGRRIDRCRAAAAGRAGSDVMNAIDVKSLGKVAVLMGGSIAEREISLLSGIGVLKALQSQGVDAQAFDPAERDLVELKRDGFARCFIALHGRHGEDGTVQGALELLGIPYTGSGVMASAIAMDKVMTKRVWIAEGLPTPRYVSLARDELSNARVRTVPDDLGLPLIVKPPHEGSSIGVSKVLGYSQMQDAVQLAARYDAEVLCEEFIDGDEVTCPVLGGGDSAVALPVVRIVAPEGAYDYQNKYFTDVVNYIVPSGLPAAEEAAIQAIVLRAYRTLGCRGWGRADLMIRAADRMPFLLEMNTSPGMTSHSLVPMSARAAGISYEQLCLLLLQGAALDS